MLPDDMDAVFGALAHRDRRRILDLVRNNPGACVENLCSEFTTSRIAVLKHVRVLERASLIHSEKIGRKRRLYLNLVPIQIIYERWATEYSALWAGHVTGIKYRVEMEREREKQRKRKRYG